MATFTGQLISATYDAILKTIDNDAIGGTAKQLTDGLGNVTPLYVSTTQIGIGITPTEALHISGNALITGYATISGDLAWGTLTDTGQSISITKFVDQADGIANNDNDTTIPTSAAVKDLIDSSITAQDLDFSGDGGTTGAVDLDSQSLAVVGTTNEIETSASNQSLTIGLPSNVTIGNDLTITNNITTTGNAQFDGTIDQIKNSTTVTKFTGVTGSGFNASKLQFYKNTDLKIELDGETGNGIFAGKVSSSSTVSGDSSLTLTTKDYVDASVALHDTLQEVLAVGNTTGGTDIAITAGDKITNFTSTGIDDNATSNVLTIADASSTFGGDVDVNGNLDVTSTASDAVFLRSSQTTTTNVYITNTNATSNNTANLYFAPANNIAGSYIKSTAIEDFSSSANRTADLRFAVRKDGTFNESVIIDSSGNVLIGIDTISATLGSFAQLEVSDSTKGGIIINTQQASASNYSRLMFSINNNINGHEGLIRYNTSDYHMAFFTDGAEKMRITSGGNVGIGITPVSFSQLHIYDTSDIFITLQKGTDIAYLINDGTNIALASDQGSTGKKLLVDRTAPDNSLAIDSSGNSTFAGNVTVGANTVQNGTNPGLKIQSTNTSQTVLGLHNTTTRNWEVAVGGSANTLGAGLFYIYDNTANDARLVIDSSGNVGIGVTPSGYDTNADNLVVGSTGVNDKNGITIVGGDTDGRSAIYFADTTQNSAGYITYFHSNNSMLIGTSDSTALTIDSSGDVGIGNSNPSYKIDAKQTTSGNGTCDLRLAGRRANSTTSFIVSTIYAENFDNGTGDVTIGKIDFSIDGDASSDQSQYGKMIFSTANNSSEVIALTIDSSQNIGIGTDTPSALLEIQTAGTTGSQDFQIFSRGESPNYEVFKISRAAGSTELLANQNLTLSADYDANHTSVDSNIIFKTDNTEKMRIDNSGNVGIGTISPQQLLHINNTSGDFGAEAVLRGSTSTGTPKSEIAFKRFTSGDGGTMVLRTSNSSGTLQDVLTLDTSKNATFEGNVKIGDSTTAELLIIPTTNNTAPALLQFHKEDTGASTVLQFLQASGEKGSISYTNTTTSFNTTSDYRLKEDLQDFAGLDMVSKIPVYDFKWKLDESRSYGVMAHELQEVLPDAVTGEKDAEEMQGVDYSKIVPLLVKSIQELKAEVDLLKQECKCK